MSVSGKMSLPLMRAIAVRTFASAQPKPAQVAASHAGIVSTVLPNKIFVGTCDNGSPSARISIAYKAGSRYEPASDLGLTHVLRIAAGFTTSGASTFAIIRNLQQFGANLTATVDRETIVYTLEGSKANIEDAVQFLTDVASKQIFFPWEIQDNMYRIRYEIAGLSPQVRAMDLLHKAAYRRGLGNSIFCAPKKIGKISSDALKSFVAENLTANRCAVGASGLSLERTIAIAQTLNLPAGGSKPDAPSPYKGGEMRKEMGGDIANVAMAVEGVSLANAKEALALAILSRAVATGPQVKWGNDNSPLAKAIATQNPGVPFAANGFNISFSDSGMFGIMLSAPASTAGKVVQAAGQMLKKGITSLPSDALKKGRAQLQTEVLSVESSLSEMADNIATQGVLTGTLRKPSEIADDISKISDSDISSVASKISKGKISMGAAGALIDVPYADEI